MPFEKVRNFFARHVHREINIYRIDDFNLEKPEIIKNKTRLKVEHSDLNIKVTASNPFNLDEWNFECKALKCKLFSSPAKSYNQKIKRYVKQDVKTHKAKFVQSPKISFQLKQIQNLPQERRNILKLQKKKPKVADNEMILACYGPIVEGAVERLVLNKQQGTLFVWYSASSRQRKDRNVYLIRRLGMNAKPEWRWQ